jgi:hypothetical protein
MRQIINVIVLLCFPPIFFDFFTGFSLKSGGNVVSRYNDDIAGGETVGTVLVFLQSEGTIRLEHISIIIDDELLQRAAGLSENQ